MLDKAKKLDFILKKNLSEKELNNTLEMILSDEHLLGYNFNSIWEISQRLKKEGKFEQLSKLQNKLKNSSVLKHFLMRKFSSKELGTLRKIDYYSFYRDMTGDKVESIEKQIRKSSLKLLTANVNDYNRLDYIHTLFSSLLKNKLLLNSDLLKLAKDAKNSAVLVQVISAISSSETVIKDSNIIIQQVFNSNKVSDSALAAIASLVKNNKIPTENVYKILQQIVNSDHAGAGAIGMVAYSIGASDTQIAGSAEMFQQMINSNKNNHNSLATIVEAIGRSKKPIINTSKMFQQIIDSNKSTDYALQKIATAIGSSKSPIKEASIILQQILDSGKIDDSVLDNVARTIGRSKVPIKGSAKMLQQIINSNESLDTALSKVAIAITLGNPPYKNV